MQPDNSTLVGKISTLHFQIVLISAKKANLFTQSSTRQIHECSRGWIIFFSMKCLGALVILILCCLGLSATVPSLLGGQASVELAPRVNVKVLGVCVITGVCCARSCGTCGGEGCDKRIGGAANCCFETIVQAGKYCRDAPPPCINRPPPTDPIPQEPPCTDTVCCNPTCRKCGGLGCELRPGGESNCCKGPILASNKKCTDKRLFPCVKDPASRTPSPMPSISFKGLCDDRVCCAPSCGVCGGVGCGQRPGGLNNCCMNIIAKTTKVCKSDGIGPCVWGPEPFDPAAGPPICTDQVCCSPGCEVCGGFGCGIRRGGSINCCVGSILSSGKKCSATLQYPCVL